MRGPRCQTAEQIEDEIAKMPKPPFHVVPEDVEEPHITHKVQKPAVQEQRGKKGEHLLACGEVCSNVRFGVAGRDKTVEIDEFLEPSPLEQFDDKRQHGDGNDADVDNRKSFRSIGIANRYHDVIRLTKYPGTVNDIACHLVLFM